MFWNRKSSARNVRKNIWKPEFKPNLLDRASEGLSETKSRKPWREGFLAETNDKERTTKIRWTHSNAPAPATPPSPAQESLPHHAPSIPINIDRPFEEPNLRHKTIGLLLSESAPPTSFKKSSTDPSWDQTQSTKTAELIDSTQANRPLRKNHSRFLWVLLVLWLSAPLLGYYLNPWFSQSWRARAVQPLTKADDLVLMVMPSTMMASEESFFAGMERLLRSDTQVVGFTRPPHSWLPQANDPLQFDRLTQMLERFPNVVVGLSAQMHGIPQGYRATPEGLHQALGATHLFLLPADRWKNAPTLYWREISGGLSKLMPRLSLGFLEEPNPSFAENIENWQSFTFMAKVDPSLYSPSFRPVNGYTALQPSFAVAMVMNAQGARAGQFRAVNSWWGEGLANADNEWIFRKDARYAPPRADLSAIDALPVLTWEDWLSKGRSADLQGKIVIVGERDSPTIATWSPKGLPFSWSSLITRQLDSRDFPKISKLNQQAQLILQLRQNQTLTLPDIFAQTLWGWLALTLALALALVFRYLATALLLTFSLATLVLSILPSMSLIHASLLAFVLIPVVAMIHRHRAQMALQALHLPANGSLAPHSPAPTISKKPIAPTEKTLNEPRPPLFPTPSAPSPKKMETPVEKAQVAPPSSTIAPPMIAKEHEERSPIFNEARRESAKPLSEPPKVRSGDDKLAWVHLTERENKMPHDNPFADSAPTSAMSEPLWQSADGRPVTQVIDEVVAPLTQSLDATMSSSESLSADFFKRHAHRAVDTQLFNQLLSENLGGVAQSSAIAEPPSSAQHIGRYVVEKVLGKGAMGVVYLGLDPHINRKVAIKTVPLPSDSQKNEKELIAAKFFREAQAAGKLNHPGIVTVFDAGLYRDNVYIAMEYLEGYDLSKYTQAPHLLPLPTVLNVVARVAEALHFAHERGVVHRDIKPANIIFDSAHNLVKVTDFGIAHIHDSNRAMTQVLVGSPNYMSPEHLTGEALDGRTDLFSLGVTLYVLACGNTPFSADNVNRLMFRILNDPPRDPREFNANLPEVVLGIIHRSLQKSRENRYPSGAAMAQDLIIAQKSINSPPQ